MKFYAIKPVSCLKGEAALSGDKSIAHRAVILSAISSGISEIDNFPSNQDCFSTVECFRKLGVKIITLNKNYSKIKVFGRGLWGLTQPNSSIFIKESGTTLRLILGILAGQDFQVKLTAGKSLSLRPMLRITKPLRMMGAKIIARGTTREEFPPITIKGGKLRGITYKMPVASAQVKSAILLAGLYTPGKTEIIEPIPTRDHTERILKAFGAQVLTAKNKVVLRGQRPLISPGKIYIPGDISSASFFMVAAALLPKSRVKIKNVSLNVTRTGIIKVLKRMGGQIRVTQKAQRKAHNEPMGNILALSSNLKGVTVSQKEIPSLIDELPILMVAASLSKGRTIFKGIEELRVKETDRIKSMCDNLKMMGADISVVKSGNSEQIVINGVSKLRGAKVKSFGDHRTAMSMVVAAMAASGPSEIDDISCIDKSFPDFLRVLKSLTKSR